MWYRYTGDRQHEAVAAFLGGGLMRRLNRVMGNVLLLDWSGCDASLSICGKAQT